MATVTARFVCAAALAVAATACTDVTDVSPEGRALVLVSVVVADADSAFVMLGRTEPGMLQFPELGAQLVLEIDGTERTLVEGEPGTCGEPRPFQCYRAHLGGAADPADEVVLRGRTASGIEIEGRSRVPEVPPITFETAGPGDTVRGVPLAGTSPGPEMLGLDDVEGWLAPADTLVLATVWTPGGTRTCPVRVVTPTALDLRFAPRVSAGVAAPECGDGEPLAWDSMAAAITFLAYDENFSAWAAAGPDVGLDEASFGIAGARGVFGTATPRRFLLIVQGPND